MAAGDVVRSTDSPAVVTLASGANALSSWRTVDARVVARSAETPAETAWYGGSLGGRVGAQVKQFCAAFEADCPLKVGRAVLARPLTLSGAVAPQNLGVKVGPQIFHSGARIFYQIPLDFH